MDKPEPGLHFKLMALTFKIRDFFAPRANILKEVGIRPGFCVLDYGCGSGSYITAAAELLGTQGRFTRSTSTRSQSRASGGSHRGTIF